jgi:general stress protein 26
MSNTSFIAFGKKLIETSDAVYLTTMGENGFPETRAMLNLRNREQYPSLVTFFESVGGDFLVYFTTNASSSKVTQIKKNPIVSAYYCRPKDWRGLMLNGSIEIVDDAAIKRALWQDSWTMYYPGDFGPSNPDYAVLRLRPRKMKGYQNLSTETLEFDI